MTGENFQKYKKQLVKFWRLRNKGKKYLKSKKQKPWQIKKKIRNTTSYNFTVLLITQRVTHGWLKNWIGRLLRFFWNLKPVKISKNDTNIICLSSKNTLFFKLTRMWLKNWACHAHFNFEIQFFINQSIFELKTSPSGFKLLRYRVKIVVFTARL